MDDANITPEETQKIYDSKKHRTKGKKKIEKLTNALKKLKIEYVPIDTIKPNEYNPNRQDIHEFELLCKSIQEDGFTQPILATKKGTVIDGEHRWRASKSLGFKEIPVVFVDYTDAQRRISTLRHNRARGSEDIQLSADVLKDLEKLGALDWAQDSLMLSDLEMQRLMEEISTPEVYGKDHEFNEAFVIDQSQEIDTDERKISTSETAKQTVIQREIELNTAKTEEEREEIKQKLKLFTISFNYITEEYKIVKKVLGDSSAKKLYEICKGIDKNGSWTN